MWRTCDTSSWLANVKICPSDRWMPGPGYLRLTNRLWQRRSSQLFFIQYFSFSQLHSLIGLSCSLHEVDKWVLWSGWGVGGGCTHDERDAVPYGYNKLRVSLNLVMWRWCHHPNSRPNCEGNSGKQHGFREHVNLRMWDSIPWGMITSQGDTIHTLNSISKSNSNIPQLFSLENGPSHFVPVNSKIKTEIYAKENDWNSLNLVSWRFVTKINI